MVSVKIGTNIRFIAMYVTGSRRNLQQNQKQSSQMNDYNGNYSVHNYSGIYNGFRHIIADCNVSLCQTLKLQKCVVRTRGRFCFRLPFGYVEKE